MRDAICGSRPGVTSITRLRLLVVMLLCLTVACGSTVRDTGPASQELAVSTDEPADQGMEVDADGVTAAIPAPGGTSAPPAGAGARPGSATNQGAGGGPSTATPIASGTTSSGGGAAGSPNGEGAAAPAPQEPGQSAGTAPSGPVEGQGFDAEHVYVGVPTQNDFNQAASNLGLEGIDIGDLEGNARAMADFINQQGGILDREVVVHFHDNRTSSLIADGDRVAQENCTDFTEDRPVVAVINAVTLMQAQLTDCLAANRTVVVNQGNFIDEEFVADYSPYLYAMLTVVVERFAPALVDRLRAMDYFTPWDTTTGGSSAVAPVKVGLFYNDYFTTNRAFALIEQVLQQQGIEVAATYAYQDPPVGDVQNAQLQFAAAGVTHVITDYGLATQQFMNTAESQRYRPRYALHTFQAPAVMTENAPAAQLSGALGIGFSPHQDLAAEQNQSDVSPAAGQCRETYVQAGLVYPRGGTAEMVAFAFCDAFRFLADALNAAGGFGAETLRSGAGQVGPGFQSASTFRSAFSDVRFDQVGAVRDLGWNADCGCLQYLNDALHAL